MYIELKAGDAIPAVVQAIQEEDLYPAVIVASFRPDWLAWVKAADPHITTSVLFGAPNVDPVKLAQAISADYVHPCWENITAAPHTLLTPEWVRRVHESGLGIITWHEERPSEIAALRSLGVDGICSNNPEILG
jgi:glycerophosphoryl diester phosphodiesterase